MVCVFRPVLLRIGFEPITRALEAPRSSNKPTEQNQKSFLVFLRLPDKLMAEILALFGTVVFSLKLDSKSLL